MKYVIFLFSLFCAFFVSCSDSNILNESKIDIGQLNKKWVHSFEENEDYLNIFRPIDYKEFSPSWYRRTYTFENDGTCKYLFLAPNDAHYEIECNWTYNEADHLVSIFSKNGEKLIVLEIFELNSKLLKVRTENL